MNITDIFTSPLIFPMFAGALLIGVLIAVAASLLGVTLVLKKYSMLGDGLAHIGFGAMAIGALCEKLFSADESGSLSLLISVPLVIVAAILILKLGESERLSGDSAIALVSVGALAAGYIIYKFATGQSSDVCSSMFGSASLLTPTTFDIVFTVVLSLAVIVTFVVCYNRIYAVTFDETFSKAVGVKTEKYETIIAVLVAVTIVMGMKMLGTVMISGLIVIPSLSAMRISKTFKGVVVLSAVISAACSAAGILSAFLVNNVPIGPAVVLINLLVYIVLTIADKLKNKA